MHCPTEYWLPREGPFRIYIQHMTRSYWGKSNFHSDDVPRDFPWETKKMLFSMPHYGKKQWSIPITPMLRGYWAFRKWTCLRCTTNAINRLSHQRTLWILIKVSKIKAISIRKSLALKESEHTYNVWNSFKFPTI